MAREVREQKEGAREEAGSLGASDPAGGRGGSLRRAAVVDSDLADTEDCTSFVRTRAFPVRSNAEGAREYASRFRLLAREQA